MAVHGRSGRSPGAPLARRVALALIGGHEQVRPVGVRTADMQPDERSQRMALEAAHRALERMTLTRACLEYGHLLVAIVVLVVLLIHTMPPGAAALYALLTLFGLDAITRVMLLPAAFGPLWPGFGPTTFGIALLPVVVVRQVIAWKVGDRPRLSVRS